MVSATPWAMTPVSGSGSGSASAAVEPVAMVSLLAAPPGGDRGTAERVWVLDTGDVALEELDEARGWLDEEEREQASSYVRAELRHSYEIAHAAARRILGADLGIGPAEVVWGRHDCPGCGEPHGRPRVEGAAVEFSLAHTPGLVLVAVADRAVGVDAERFPDAEGLSGLTGVLHPEEIAEIDAAEDRDEAVLRFTRAWTRTEAYLKGVGIGLGRDPQLDYLGTGPVATRRLGEWEIADVRVPEGYAAAVALHDR